MVSNAIENRKKIRKSGIENVFTPHAPITGGLFSGRANEIDKIVESLDKIGNHVVLYGDRGVGKTSLAKHASNIYHSNLGEDKDVNISVPCTPNDTFESVINNIFTELNIQIDEDVQTEKKGGVTVKMLSGSIKKTVSTHKNIQLDNPSWVAKQLHSQKGVIIIDEFDTLSDKGEKVKFSLLMKALSDKQSELSLFIVGISLSIDELMEGHASIDRCLTQVHLQRMSDPELLEIIENGEKGTKLNFEKEVKDEIVSKSLGFPYYVHFLALETSKVAVLDDRKKVTTDDFEQGLENALKSVDQSLKKKYSEVIGNNESISKKKILYAAAKVGDKGKFTMQKWIETYKDLYKENIENVTINNATQNAIGNDGEKLLRRVQKGVYLFNDSRIPCYIMMLGKPE